MHDRRFSTVSRISVEPQGGQAIGWSSQPTISADGRSVGFYSFARNLVPGDSNSALRLMLPCPSKGKEEFAGSAGSRFEAVPGGEEEHERPEERDAPR